MTDERFRFVPMAPGSVRGDEAVWRRQRRVIARERLRVGDIEPGRAEVAGAQRGNERLLIDDDFFDGKLNTQGFVFMGIYAITDALSFTINYGFGDQIDKKIGTGGSAGGIPANPLRDYQLLQAELMLRF